MTTTRQVLSVSDLVRRAKRLLEDDFGLLWLEGEISNFSAPSSGHWYFSLKDDNAQVRAACFRNRNQLLSRRPKDGDKVLVRARVTLYEARGEFQLSVEYLEAAGFGQLQQQFEALKQKLADQGLFAAARKKTLPTHLQTLGIITSPSGAAIRDVLSVLQRRAPHIRVIIYPALVQGNDAPAALLNALQNAQRRHECDALLITRGGGSFEDLFCFNDEKLARAIAACPLPTISAVGHEVDFSIADFVADLRAPTPSAAAEMLARDQREVLLQLSQLGKRLTQAQSSRITALTQRLTHCQQRLPSPQRLLETRAQRFDEIQARLPQAMRNRLQLADHQIKRVAARLQTVTPQHRLHLAREKYLQAHTRLHNAQQQSLRSKRQQVQQQAATLHVLSPLSTLTRGYSITRLADSKHIVKATTPLAQGALLETLSQGEKIYSAFVERKTDKE